MSVNSQIWSSHFLTNTDVSENTDTVEQCTKKCMSFWKQQLGTPNRCTAALLCRSWEYKQLQVLCAAELCEMASKEPSGFWRAFKTQKHNVCPVESAAQFEAFRALMGAQPAQTPEQAELSGTSVRAADASCLNAPVTSDELHDCIKRLKRNKSAGIDGILSEMIKDGGEVLHSCLLVIFQSNACESLSQTVVCWLDHRCLQIRQ